MTSFLMLLALSSFVGACSSSSDASKENNANAYANCVVGTGGEQGPVDTAGLQAEGVVNGRLLAPDASISRSTVTLLSKMMTGSGQESLQSCTGVVIAPDLILTAAHCVRFEAGLSPAERAAKTTVVASVDPMCAILGHQQSGIAFQAREIFVAPGYTREKKEHDLALIFLSGQVPGSYRAMPMALRSQRLSGNETVFVAGYGRTQDLDKNDPDENRLRYGSLRVADPQERFVFAQRQIDGAADGPYLILRNDEDSAACKGDSGGPAIVRDAQGRLRVAGIASFIYSKDYSAVSCRSRVAYTRVSAYGDWIRKASKGRIR